MFPCDKMSTFYVAISGQVSILHFFLVHFRDFIGHKQQEKQECEIYVVFMFGLFIQQCWQHFFTLQSAGADYKQLVCISDTLGFIFSQSSLNFESEDCNFLWKSFQVFMNYSGFVVLVVRDVEIDVKFQVKSNEAWCDDMDLMNVMGAGLCQVQDHSSMHINHMVKTFGASTILTATHSITFLRTEYVDIMFWTFLQAIGPLEQYTFILYFI